MKMGWKGMLLLVVLCFLKLERSDGYVEAISANVDISQTRAEKQVAMVCDKSGARYHNQYMDASGHWISDLEGNKGCMKNKVDIVSYCQQIYPNVEFTDVVESAHSHLIEDWCKVGHKKCKESFWVKPFRCLEGMSRTDPLSPPDMCRSDTVQNASQCLNFDGWSRIVNQSCKDHGMELDSFVTQHPCGTELYSGAEFVCCPRKGKKIKAGGAKNSILRMSPEANGEYVTSRPPFSDEASTRDPYFTKFDPRIEHDAFKAAERRLEKSHRRKITKIMKEWTELEERYQKIKSKNPAKADKFKLKMNERFQRMMNALKDQGAAEKHQLIDLHQQRIVAHIDERKKDGMKCLVRALNEKPPSSEQVDRCLNHLIRALYKDRHHTISHFNHLMLTNPSQAQARRAASVDHLRDIQRMVNESLQMLDRYPDIKATLLPEMMRLSEELQLHDAIPAELMPTPAADGVRSDAAPTPAPAADAGWSDIDANRIDIDVEVERRPAALAERRLDPVVAHAQTHEHAHGEATFRVLESSPSPSGGRGLYLMVALASLALTVALVAGAVALRRRQRAPRHHGFVEVDQTITPEERHLAQMQVNGYENPTYRYFESK